MVTAESDGLSGDHDGSVAQKLGMQYEGRIRDHVFTNGARRDSLLYAVLKPEWP